MDHGGHEPVLPLEGVEDIVARDGRLHVVVGVEKAVVVVLLPDAGVARSGRQHGTGEAGESAHVVRRRNLRRSFWSTNSYNIPKIHL